MIQSIVNINCKIFHDSEWSGTTWISTCLLFTIQYPLQDYQFQSKHQQIIIYYNDSLPFDRDKIFIHEKIRTEYLPISSFVYINEHFISILKETYWNCNIQMINFFSPTDIFYIFPQYFPQALFKDEREILDVPFTPFKNDSDKIFFDAARRLKGYVKIDDKKIYFEDYSKIFGHGSLYSKLLLFGLANESKTLMDDYKATMHLGLEKYPKEFFQYAIDDVTALPLIKEKAQEVFSKICEEVGALKSQMSLTIGGTVNKLLTNCIKTNFHPIVWTLLEGDGLKSKYTIKPKVPLVDALISYAPKTLKNRLLIYRQSNSKDLWIHFQKDKEVKEWLYKITNREASLLGILSHRGIVTKMSTDNNILNLALVVGGRCNNEHPEEQYIENVIDVDISSCYSNIMSKLEIPIGGFHTDLDYNITTIKEFIDQLLNKVYKHYWVISFNTKLSFDQDLFVSKLYKPEKLAEYARKLSLDEDEELQDFHTTILRREIVNGILTQPLLDIVLTTWQPHEQQELFSSLMTRAVFYLKKDKREIDKFSSEINFNKYRSSNIKSFTTFSLADLVTTIRDKRNSYKQTSKVMAEALKTIGNTIYGVMCSPYFDVGNVLVANLITSIARAQVYMMAKAFRLVQTITDGGLFSLQKLNQKPKLFSSSVLINNLQTFALDFSVDDMHCTSVTRRLTQALVKHLWEFWSSLKSNKLLFFSIELKLDNTSYAASYSRKADYVLMTINKKMKVKVRGYKADGYSEKVEYYKAISKKKTIL
jgi:hypothetical protein